MAGMCPKADDPMTKNQQFRQIRLTTTAASGEFGGAIGFYFHDEQVILNANGSALDSGGCTRALRGFPNIAKASCSRENVTRHNGASYIITIESWPIHPHQNNLFEHQGNPPLSAFSCDLTKVAGVYGAECTLADVTNQNIIGMLIATTTLPIRSIYICESRIR